MHIGHQYDIQNNNQTLLLTLNHYPLNINKKKKIHQQSSGTGSIIIYMYNVILSNHQNHKKIHFIHNGWYS